MDDKSLMRDQYPVPMRSYAAAQVGVLEEKRLEDMIKAANFPDQRGAGHRYGGGDIVSF